MRLGKMPATRRLDPTVPHPGRARQESGEIAHLAAAHRRDCEPV